MKLILLISIFLIGCNSMFCNYFPLNPRACVEKTNGVKCYFNQFENACIATESTSHGCQKNLNEMACLNQLTNQQGQEIRCHFGQKCLALSLQHLKKLGCSEKFSKYACTNVMNKDCFWNGSQCIEYKENIPSAQNCEEIFSTSVTPSLCQKIKEIKCMNGGFSNQYLCINVTDIMLSEIHCNDLGINEVTCISIVTPNQSCIFYQEKCQNITHEISINRCDQSFNRLGCLNIKNINLQCQWKQGRCQNYIPEIDQECNDIKDVNENVCANQQQLCQYDINQFSCIQPKLIEKITCNTRGLTKELCLQLKNQYCTYFNGYCQELSKDQLNYYQCEMLINEDSCINIQTKYQYCQWDGQQCQRIIMNQNQDCKTQLKVNGNVCQSISKQDILCKYDLKNHNCIESQQNDFCDSPFLNLYGCVSINRPGFSCQWTINGCIQIKIKQLETKCSSLGYANPISCSQVLENQKTGCYFDSNTQQCISFDIEQSINIINNLECTSQKFGLNKIACASITKSGIICRWNQNQCTQIKRKSDIAQIECIKMQYVNQQACALIEFGKEPCRYLKSQLGCVNSLQQNMACNSPGLNSFACSQAKGSCYFDTEQYICKELDSSNPNQTSKIQLTTLLSTMECVLSSPTKDVCQQITTVGQQCMWSIRLSKCIYQSVIFNQKCQDYQGQNISINANVCAAIEMDFPDYNILLGSTTDVDRGYCKFNPGTGNCEKNGDACTTPCCTEKVGINSHSCSRFSSQQPNVYCYFSNELKCSQLTSDIVDIYNEQAVKNFYNANQMKCSQMNRLSCHMIEWSTKQQCYHNGKSCINLNYSNYQNLNIFIQPQAILNKWACLAIEASISDINSLKYFEYNPVLKRCQIKLSNDGSYSSCDKVVGNRNICMNFTDGLKCRWNESLLKCVEITEDEYEEIYTCSYNQNKNVCISNPNTACQFSYTNDRCIDSPTNVKCNYFDINGPVSANACLRITADGQMCQYNSDKQSCKATDAKDDSGCNVPGTNSITCYNRTQGNCRWDPNEYICYVNQEDISTLGCEDYLNQVLCLQITKEPCTWDVEKYKCIKQTLTDKQFISSSNSYNKLTCYNITGGGYYYKNGKCIPSQKSDYTCQEEYLNEYACLFQTQGSLCYFDKNESVENYRCKPYTGQQTRCSTNIAINIDICMQIPQTCVFNLNTLKCESTTISDTTTCSNLNLQRYNGLYPNRMSCISISDQIESTDGIKYCYPHQDNVQQCNYEKNCYYSSYQCQIWKPTDDFYFGDVERTCGEEETPPCTWKWCTQRNLVTGISKCSNNYSKALCLQMVTEQCYFDLQQGGCNQLIGNEHKLPDCMSISNNCDVSQTQQLACQNKDGSGTTEPGAKCLSVTKNVSKCMNNGDIIFNLTCEEYSTVTTYVVCASATDSCRFDNGKCTSTEPQKNNDDTYPCDKSMSKTMCETLNCNYDKLGYCQQTEQVIQSTSTNQNYICNEVNLLKIQTKAQVCAQINQSCIYTNKCEDCTGYTCDQLSNAIVSQLACISCKGQSVQYDPIKYLCNSINESTVISTCDTNLNYYSCLLNTKDIYCKWSNNQCTDVDIQNESSNNCTIFNQKSCIYVTTVQCYVNKTTNLCDQLDPKQVDCIDIFQESICNQSFKQICKWNTTDEKCNLVDTIDSTYTCELSNKYGCLNMPDKYCGWSKTDNKCYGFTFQSSNLTCSNFANAQQNISLDYYNPISCSQVNIDEICFNDNQYQCREAVSADIITCDTKGLNKYGCINRAIGKCKFVIDSTTNIGQCLQTNETNLNCTDFLNIDACLNQDKICKFVNNKCQDYSDFSLDDKFPYSIKVCQLFSGTDSIIYSLEKKRCVKAGKRGPFITQCNQQGINKYACLNKTTGLCQYDDTLKQCQTAPRDQFKDPKDCNSKFSWYSCIQLNFKCKFINNLCQQVQNTEKCSDLVTNNVLVNALVCQSREFDESCKLDQNTNQCVLISGKSEICTQPGLNKQGCLFTTKGSFCQYKENQCIDNFDNLLCSDIINEDKCYSIRTKGQFCKFDLIIGCHPIDQSQVNLSQCVQDLKTNPNTCSQSTDIPCFYDKNTYKCIEYTQPQQNSNLLLYDWSNSISLNQKACVLYNENKLAVQWLDGCVQISSSQFQYLTCSSLVNKKGCLGITNKTQNCYFSDNQCKTGDLSQFISKDCTTITDINSPNFCEVNDQCQILCGYDSSTKACIEIVTPDGCEDKGYNQYACPTEGETPECVFENNRCYTNSGTQFCKNATISNCHTVLKEGCNLECQSISQDQYSTLNCEQTLNPYGCSSINKQDQYCHFQQNKCINVSPNMFKDEKCINIKDINNQQFCEQPTDVSCIYNQETRACLAVSLNDQFSCMRGINKLACSNQTVKSLKCQFFDYCYGPNDSLLDCKPKENDDPNKCCLNAINKESCLLQNIYYCQWIDDSCQPYIFQQQDCNTIQNKSRNVCYNQQNSPCIFNSNQFQCQSTQLTSCDLAQTKQQCTQVINVPCYWNNEYQECQYKVQKNSDQCKDILTMNGNIISCLMINRQGQLCQFKDYQCQTFEEIKQQNNCYDNINYVACTQQQSSYCYWKLSVIKIKKTSWSVETDLEIGQCQQFNDFNLSECNKNLSYLSCLKIITQGKQCRWLDNICQQIQINKNQIFNLSNLQLVNSNSCGLINNGDLVQYNPITFNCQKITDINIITCQPFIEGLNKLACMKIQTQQCYWDDKNNQCLLKSRLLVENQLFKYRLLQQSKCRVQGIGPKLCRLLNFELPCASVDDGCDQIDINTATCDTLGLNKYGCLNLTTGPCLWTKDDENDINSNYHCEEYYPFGICDEVPVNVNSIVCSYVEENSCTYNKLLKKCEIPTIQYNKCEIDGINAVGCSKIDGCIFKDQKCIKWNSSYNLLCSDAINANQSVCQLAIDRCKFSELTSGCIASTITDNCYTEGLSALGCNVLDQCKWNNNKCQCIAYLNKFPECNTLTEYAKCQNIDYCYFEVSSQNSSKDLTQYLKNTNFGTCRNRQCSDFDRNKCNNSIINEQLCYLNNKQTCQSAKKCEDIINPSLNCTSYKINNQICKLNKLGTGCETLNCSLIISQSECEQFSTNCVYSGFCKIRSCEFMVQTQCLQNNCDWDDDKKICQTQLDCFQITKSDQCVKKKYLGRQCAWLKTLKNEQQCTLTGCRYLGSSQGDCMGTHIGYDVCVQMSDFSCVSCEEITDACICLNQQQYCYYDNVKQKCYSQSCQAHNSENCPSTHCRYNNNNKICQPLCMYNYNQIQCNQADECIWDTVNNICISYIPEIVIIPVNLPNPNISQQFTNILIIIIILLI